MKKTIILLSFAFFVFIFVAGIFSGSMAGTISGVSGTIANGETITISGSGFGLKSTAAPLVSSYDNAKSSDNFHSLPNGGVLHGSGGAWDSSRSTETVLENDPSLQRTSFYQADYYAMCPYLLSGYANVGYQAPMNSGAWFYTSMWYRVTKDYICLSTASSNSKFWRYYSSASPENSIYATFFGGPTGGVCGPNVNHDTNTLGTDIAGGSLGIDYHQPTYPLNEWVHYEMWFYVGSNSDDMAVTEIVNGQTIRTWDGDGHSLVYDGALQDLNQFRFGQVSGANHYEDGGSILISEVYVDNSQAHVFISDRNTFPSNWIDNASAAHNEVQVCTSWSDASVACTLNQGTFSVGETVYLYVVDENGQVNTEGYPITIGGSGSSGGDGGSNGGAGDGGSGCFIFILNGAYELKGVM